MKFKKLIVAIIAVALLFVPVLSSTTYASAANKEHVSKNYVSDVKKGVLKRINQKRANHHWKPVKESKSLDKLAQKLTDEKMAYILGGYDRSIKDRKPTRAFHNLIKGHKNLKKLNNFGARTWNVKRFNTKQTIKNMTDYYFNSKRTVYGKKNTKEIGIGFAYAYNQYREEYGNPEESLVQTIM
ncbi:hypothetical protein [Apilactobacillus kunkeei]|uniref:SCP domain-containing protein n=1 Tax=Apilactobacillus kunkeei TaxID=148814 RepID=A0A0M9DG24_9LACO|nr:hypothetical protein [Apilactobacillus kunkeei]KOY79456.1 hypothetical protein RZ72_10150 [Apilactobacillus kunkeei]